MKLCRVLLSTALAMFCLTSCAKGGKNMVVVLLPGPDGKTGQIVVYNEGGSRIIGEPGVATEIKSPKEAPSEPFVMNKESIDKDFGEVLSILPSPPLHFTLYFHTGTTILTEESRKLLASIMTQIASRKTMEVSVVGHTDRVGSRQMNYKLGLERAMEMKQFLASQGIDPRNIETESHGEDNPLVKTGDGVPEPRNRRVEVILR